MANYINKRVPGFIDPVSNTFPRMTAAFCVDGTATWVGALMGIPPLTTYIESATGGGCSVVHDPRLGVQATSCVLRIQCRTRSAVAATPCPPGSSSGWPVLLRYRHRDSILAIHAEREILLCACIKVPRLVATSRQHGGSIAADSETTVIVIENVEVPI